MLRGGEEPPRPLSLPLMVRNRTQELEWGGQDPSVLSKAVPKEEPQVRVRRKKERHASGPLTWNLASQQGGRGQGEKCWCPARRRKRAL